MRPDRAALLVYLNDHLAGSMVALTLMGRICAAHADSDLGALLTTLRAEVEEEQTLLRALVTSAGGTESTLAQAVAWVGEKLSRRKIGPGTADDSGLVLFEALELLTLGFVGRQALWRTLAELARVTGIRSDTDFAALVRRTESHLSALESLRLRAAMTALTVPAGE